MGQRANHGDKHRGAYAKAHGTHGLDTFIEICSCGAERLATFTGPKRRTKGLTPWMSRGELEAQLRETRR